MIRSLSKPYFTQLEDLNSDTDLIKKSKILLIHRLDSYFIQLEDLNSDFNLIKKNKILLINILDTYFTQLDNIIILTTYKMFYFDDITDKNDIIWPYRTLIIGLSRSGKNCLLNLIPTDNSIIDKIYLYAKDLEEPKYQLLITKREDAGIKHLTAFIEYSNSMDDIYENIEGFCVCMPRQCNTIC